MIEERLPPLEYGRYQIHMPRAASGLAAAVIGACVRALVRLDLPPIVAPPEAAPAEPAATPNVAKASPVRMK